VIGCKGGDSTVEDSRTKPYESAAPEQSSAASKTGGAQDIALAKAAIAKADLATLKNGVSQFLLDCGRYPTTSEGLGALVREPAKVQGWRGPYISKNVLQDPWSNPFHYEYIGNDSDKQFDIASYGSDGKPGGDGSAADIHESLE